MIDLLMVVDAGRRVTADHCDGITLLQKIDDLHTIELRK